MSDKSMPFLASFCKSPFCFAKLLNRKDQALNQSEAHIQTFHGGGQNFLSKKFFVVSKKFYVASKKFFVVSKKFFVASKKIFVMQKKFSEFAGFLSFFSHILENLASKWQKKKNLRQGRKELIFGNFICNN